jgi:hypothetical protein
VVAVLEGKHLVVYADRFASNEPVAKAKVEIEGAGLKGVASETTPGTYVLDLSPHRLPPAMHPLTISVEAGDSTDRPAERHAGHHRLRDHERCIPTAGASGSSGRCRSAAADATGIWFAVRRHKRAKKGI